MDGWMVTHVHHDVVTIDEVREGRGKAGKADHAVRQTDLRVLESGEMATPNPLVQVLLDTGNRPNVRMRMKQRANRCMHKKWCVCGAACVRQAMSR